MPPAVIGGGLALGGALLSGREQRRAQDAAIQASTTELNPFNFFGPGGITAGFGQTVPTSLLQPAGIAPGALGFNPFGRVLDSSLQGFPFGGNFGQLGPAIAGGLIPSPTAGFQTGGGLQDPGQAINIGLGNLDPIFNNLVNFAGGSLEAAGGGIPSFVQDAFSAAQGVPLPTDVPGLEGLLARSGSVLGGAQQDLNAARGGFQTGLQDAAFGGALTQLGDIQGGQAAADARLALLREQAAPFEERAFSNLQDNQFATGRLGTTGGSLQTEAFARGLGQADLSRQLAAAAEGRAFQQNALGLASGLSGLGGGLAGLGEQLTSGAFNRFASSLGLNQDVNQTLFNRGLGLNQIGFDRAQTGLANALNFAQFGPQLSGLNLTNTLNALTGQSGLFSQGLSGFNAALQAAMAQANAQIGAGSNIASIVGSPNFSASPFGDFLTAFGTQALGSSAGGGLFSGLFNTTSPTASSANQQILSGVPV